MNTKILYLFFMLLSVVALSSCQDDEVGGYATAEEVKPYTGVYRGRMTTYIEDTEKEHLWQQVKIETLADTIALSIKQFRVAGLNYGDIMLKKVEAQKEGEAMTFHAISNEYMNVSGFKMNVEVTGKIMGSRLDINYSISSIRTPSVSGRMFAERQTHIADDSVAIVSLTLDNKEVLVQPEIDNENRVIRFYVTDTISDTTRIMIRPRIQLYPGCSSIMQIVDSVEMTLKNRYGFTVWAEDSVHASNYLLYMTAVRSYTHNFDTWKVAPLQETDTAGQYYQYLEPYRWATNNDWIRWAKKNGCYAKSQAYPVERVKDAYNNYAARIRTLKVSKGSEKFPYYLHAGMLFIGSYEVDPQSLASKASHGETFDSRPVSVTGYYKYQPGSQLFNNNEGIEGQDTCCFRAVLYEVVNSSETLDYTQMEKDSRIVATGMFQSAEKVTKYTPFSFSLKFLENKSYNAARKYKLAVAFYSSKHGERLIGAPGSALYIDEVNVVGR